MKDIGTDIFGNRFELLMPLHHLWVQYATDLRSSGNEKASSSTLPPAPTDPFLPKLAKMDFHGAILTVTKSTTPSLIGQSGIMVMETAKTFKLVTRQNTLKLVTKTGTVFALKLGNVVYTVYGSAIQYRSSERAGRKFKAKPTIDL
ncbi:Rof/RNase P-like protein [Blastocladiella britannica]|nr:Rof/RNase P-like protein [Blastocladiella britannica]